MFRSFFQHPTRTSTLQSQISDSMKFPFPLSVVILGILGCKPSLDEVHVEDIHDACDCVDVSEILFTTYADVFAEHKETVDAYFEAMRTGSELRPEIQEKFENEVMKEAQAVVEKGNAIGEVCNEFMNTEAVMNGLDSVDCPNLEDARKAYERVLAIMR